MRTPPPPVQPNQHFDVCTPIIAVPQMSGLCRAHLCPTLSFEGLHYWFLPDMYPHLVIFSSFLRARPVLDHAITML